MYSNSIKECESKTAVTRISKKLFDELYSRRDKNDVENLKKEIKNMRRKLKNCEKTLEQEERAVELSRAYIIMSKYIHLKSFGTNEEKRKEEGTLRKKVEESPILSYDKLNLCLKRRFYDE
jgi:hypothetical protein